MRRRLRPAYTPAELSALYDRPHEHTRFHDHRLRIDATIAIARWMHRPGTTLADLSCGDAAIARAVNPNPILGDYAPGYQIQGPIEETVESLPLLDTYICSETIEHLDDPDTVLTKIRDITRALVLSTPIDEDNDGNPEHYWGWSVDDVRGMLTVAGFTPMTRIDLHFDEYPYSFQIWGCV